MFSRYSGYPSPVELDDTGSNPGAEWKRRRAMLIPSPRTIELSGPWLDLDALIPPRWKPHYLSKQAPSSRVAIEGGGGGSVVGSRQYAACGSLFPATRTRNATREMRRKRNGFAVTVARWLHDGRPGDHGRAATESTMVIFGFRLYIS